MNLDLLYAQAKQTAMDLKMQVPPKQYSAQLTKLTADFKQTLKDATDAFVQQAAPLQLPALLTRIDMLETQMEDLKKKVDDDTVKLSAILKTNNLKISSLKAQLDDESPPLFFDMLDATARTTMEDYQDVYMYNFKYLMVKIAVVGGLLLLVGSGATFGFFAVLYICWMLLSMAMGWSDDASAINLNK
jgi:hypothetical protein